MSEETSAQDKLTELDGLVSGLADRLGRLSDNEIEASEQIDSFCEQMKAIIGKAKENFLQGFEVRGQLTASEKEHLVKLENLEGIINILNEELGHTSNTGEVISKFKAISLSFKKLCASAEIIESMRSGQIQRYNAEIIKMIDRHLQKFGRTNWVEQALALFKKNAANEERKALSDLKNICKHFNEHDIPQVINMTELINNLKKPTTTLDPSTRQFLTKEQKARFQKVDFSEIIKEADALFQTLPEAIREPVKKNTTPLVPKYLDL